MIRRKRKPKPKFEDISDRSMAVYGACVDGCAAGRSPTRTEIHEATKINSSSTMAVILTELCDRELITIDRHISRGIRIVPNDSDPVVNLISVLRTGRLNVAETAALNAVKIHLDRGNVPETD